MGSFANSVFSLLLGWTQSAAAGLWQFASHPEGDSFLQWLGGHWIPLALALCAAGLIADLTVYLFRWRPQKVWASYFRRITGKEAETPEAEDSRTPETETTQWEAPAPRNMTAARIPEPLNRWSEEPFSREETRTVRPVRSAAAREPIVPAAVRTVHADRDVPADSPYRRPAAARTEAFARRETEYMPRASRRDEREEAETMRPPRDTDRDEMEEAASHRERMEKAIQTRRRRMRVATLFRDREDDLEDIAAPQQLIDSREAYHQPVYPKAWTRREDDADE